MNWSKRLPYFWICIFACFAINANLFGQTYRFSLPITGVSELNVGAYNGTSGNTGPSAYTQLAFTNLTEMVIYDPIHQTLRQTGSILVNGPASAASFSESVNGTNVAVTVNQQVPGNTINFDSGTISYNTNNPSHAYYGALLGQFQIDGNYSLTTGGQVYFGAFTPTNFLEQQYNNLPFYNIAAGSNVNTVVLSGSGGSETRGFLVSGGVFPVTASNGITVRLYSGSGSELDHSPFTLTTSNSVVATMVASSYAPLTFFGGNSSAGNNLYFLQFTNSAVFGYYDTTYFPYIYHYDLGWEYCTDANDFAGDIYFYDFASHHYWFTGTQTFPYVYDFSLHSWLYYYPNPSDPKHYTTNPRYFYNFSTGSIITM